MARGWLQWHGTLMFIAQPTEETVSGAKAMLADGFALMARSPMKRCAIAMGSDHPTPIASISAAAGHGAVPQATINPVMMAARFIVGVQSVVSRKKVPTEFGVVSVGALHGGTAENIIPDATLILVAGNLANHELRSWFSNIAAFAPSAAH